MIQLLPVHMPGEVKHFLDRLSCFDSTGTWVVGGAARSLLTGEEVKDFDMVFETEAVKERFMEHFELSGLVPYEENVIGQVAIDLSFPVTTVQDAIDKFDFTNSMFAFNHEGLFFGFGEAHNHVMRKVLCVHNWNQRPRSFLKRANKFMLQGYEPPEGKAEFLKKLVLFAKDNADFKRPTSIRKL